jgi:hypothetical protein
MRMNDFDWVIIRVRTPEPIVKIGTIVIPSRMIILLQFLTLSKMSERIKSISCKSPTGDLGVHPVGHSEASAEGLDLGA